jgi:hypothetical protein
LQAQCLQAQISGLQRQLEEARSRAVEAGRQAAQAQAQAERTNTQADKDQAAAKLSQFYIQESARQHQEAELIARQKEVALRRAQAADTLAQRASSSETRDAQDAYDKALDDLEFTGKLEIAARANAAADQAERDARPYLHPNEADLAKPDVFQQMLNARQSVAALRHVADRANADLESAALKRDTHAAQRAAAAAAVKTAGLRAQLADAEQHGDAAQVDTLKQQFDAAIDDESAAQAKAKEKQAAFDEHRAHLAYTDAQARWKAEYQQQWELRPHAYIDSRGGGMTTPAGYDATFFMAPTEGKVSDENGGRYEVNFQDAEGHARSAVVQHIDGTWYVIDGKSKMAMNGTTAAMWDAYVDKAAASRAKSEAHTAAQVIDEDGRLDPQGLRGKSAAIGQELEQANQRVDDASADLNRYRDSHPAATTTSTAPADAELQRLRMKLAVALEQQAVAQTSADALASLQTLSDAKRHLYDVQQSESRRCPPDNNALNSAREAVNTARAAAAKKPGDAKTVADQQAQRDVHAKQASKDLPKARTDLAAADKKVADLQTAAGEHPTPAQQSALDTARRERDLAQMNVDRFDAVLRATQDAHEQALSEFFYKNQYTDPRHSEYGSLPAPDYSVMAVGGGVVTSSIDPRSARYQVIADTALKSADAAREAWDRYGQYQADIDKMNQAVADQPNVHDTAARASAARVVAEANQQRDPKAYEDAVAAEAIALLHQQVVDTTANDWAAADRDRQIAEAGDRAAGRASDNPSPATEAARHRVRDLCDKVELLTTQWVAAKKKEDIRLAQRALDTANLALDQWKREHPGADAEQSEPYIDVLKARFALLTLQGQQTLLAADVAEQNQRDFVAKELAPDKRSDPHELWRLFKLRPELMSQALMNRDAASSGGLAVEMTNPTQLKNVIGISLGWQPTAEIDPNDPAHWDVTLRTRDVFSNLTKEQREQRDAIAKRVMEQGGRTPTISVVPVMFATPEQGVGKTALFLVESLDGRPKFVDDQGLLCQGDSIDAARADFQAHSGLPPDDVIMVMPELKTVQEMQANPGSGRFKFDADGNVLLWHGDARTEGGFEHWKRVHPWFQPAVAVAGFAAGVTMTIGSFGVLSAPGAVLMAASGYAIWEGASDLWDMHKHGLLNSAGDLVTNRRARMDGITLLGSALGLGALGSGARAASLLARGASSAGAWGRGASVAGWGAFASGGAGFVDTGTYAYENWDHLSTTEKVTTVFNLAINAMDLTGPGWQPSMRRAYEGRHSSALAAGKNVAFRVGDAQPQSTHSTKAPGLDADGVPLPPTTLGHDQWAEVARQTDSLIDRQQLAHDGDSHAPALQPSSDEAVLLAYLTANPPPLSAARFTVSKIGPEDASYGEAGLRTRRNNTYRTFEEARDAAASRGGAWVHRVEPDPASASQVRRGRVDSEEIMGSFHVDGEGRVLPLAIPNIGSRAWTRLAPPEPTSDSTPLSTPVREGTRLQRLLAGAPRDTSIRPGRVTIYTVAARLIAAVTHMAGFSGPYKYLSGPETSLAGYGVSGFSRFAWFTHGKAMKESIARATEGKTELAVEKVNRIVRHAHLKGAKLIPNDEAAYLRQVVEDIGQLAIAFRQHLDDWRAVYPQAPSAKSFRVRQIRSPEETFPRLSPVKWMTGDAALDAFYRQLSEAADSEFHGQRPQQISHELLARIEAMDAPRLARAIDESHSATTPEDQLLQQFPELRQRFADTVELRTTLAKTHEALYGKLLELLPNADKSGIEPNLAESLPGSANTPSTRLGKASRQAAIWLPLNTTLAWLGKGPLATGSGLAIFGYYADLATAPSFIVKFIYSKKVDDLTNFNESHSAAQVRADESLKAEKARLQAI